MDPQDLIRKITRTDYFELPIRLLDKGYSRMKFISNDNKIIYVFENEENYNLELKICKEMQNYNCRYISGPKIFNNFSITPFYFISYEFFETQEILEHDDVLLVIKEWRQLSKKLNIELPNHKEILGKLINDLKKKHLLQDHKCIIGIDVVNKFEHHFNNWPEIKDIVPIHGDLHSDNIVKISNSQFVIIDWENVCLGDIEFDSAYNSMYTLLINITAEPNHVEPIGKLVNDIKNTLADYYQTSSNFAYWAKLSLFIFLAWFDIFDESGVFAKEEKIEINQNLIEKIISL